MKLFLLIAVLTLASLMSSCGFQLRGVSNLPTALTQLQLIDNALNADQVKQLSDMLAKAGVKLERTDANDPLQLKVEITSLPERNLADIAGTGKAIVQISKRLSYSVKNTENIMPLQMKIIERQINIEQDSNNLLGVESENEIAERTLEKILFSQLIFELERL
jgi:LPS-assembly lipoprotein